MNGLDTEMRVGVKYNSSGQMLHPAALHNTANADMHAAPALEPDASCKTPSFVVLLEQGH